jgi:glycosyltransferase involved in cell wall biosynthesis
MRVSVIMPITRAAEAERAIASIRGQKTRHEVELLTVGSEPGVTVPVSDPNPAVRRNRAADRARGEILAFIDDDAAAAPDWIEQAVELLERRGEMVAVGGPDPAPPRSRPAELFADTLLSTRWIGSGVLCHENRPGMYRLRRPYDLALVNLLVRKDAFDRAGRFDEAVGYIGEDTALVARLMQLGEVVYHSGVLVYHRRRPFPGSFLRQRWRYRWKTGRMLLEPSSPFRRDFRLWLLLTIPILLLALLVVAPAMAVVLIAFYLAVCLSLAAVSTRLPVAWWPLIPLAFAAHHFVYFAATLGGLIRGLVARWSKWKG